MGFILVEEGNDSILFSGYEWLILKKYDDHMLVILEDVLEQKRLYHQIWKEITWEECTLRKWLNEDFYNTFTSEEQARILETHLENPDNEEYGRKGGNDTDDKIFLLSLDEAAKYMTKDERSVNSWWWLRSPGGIQDLPALVDSDGAFVTTGNLILAPTGVRPALNLKF